MLTSTFGRISEVVRPVCMLAFGASLAACGEPSERNLYVEVPPSTIELGDVPSQPGTAWIRTEGEGLNAFVELIDFHTSDPAVWVGEPRLLTHFTFRNSGVTEIDRGVASPSTDAGQGALSYAESWRYTPDPTKPPAMRTGAGYATISPRTDSYLGFVDVGMLLDVSVESRSVNFESLSDVIGRTIRSNQDDGQGASRIVAQLCFIAMLSSWTRVDGYDSVGIVDYQGPGRTIPALVVTQDPAAAVHVGATLGTSITLSFDYLSYVDFEGVMIDGSMSISFGSDGLGMMSGSPVVTISQGASALSATIDVSGIAVIDGIPSSGSVDVVIGTTSYQFDAATLLHPDLSNVLLPM